MKELNGLLKVLPELINDVKVDNPNKNPLCDAYNDGVDRMANKVMSWITTVLNANGFCEKHEGSDN